MSTNSTGNFTIRTLEYLNSNYELVDQGIVTNPFNITHGYLASANVVLNPTISSSYPTKFTITMTTTHKIPQ
jgi:hypothetical protein